MVTEDKRSRDEHLELADKWAEGIRMLCQGPGVLGDGMDVPEGLIDLFQVEDRKQLNDLIYRGITKLTPPSVYKTALQHALGLKGNPEPTLTERRNALVKRNGVSYRTLVRHEEVAARSLAGVLLLNQENKPEPDASLEDRVKRLEELVGKLQEKVSRLST